MQELLKSYLTWCCSFTNVKPFGILAPFQTSSTISLKDHHLDFKPFCAAISLNSFIASVIKVFVGLMLSAKYNWITSLLNVS